MSGTEGQSAWFSDDQLRDMTRPTMDRAIEALDSGDVDAARALCEEMKSEWRFLHDLMAEQVLALVTFIQRNFGEDQVARAWETTMTQGWRKNAGKIAEADRRGTVEALAATWRAHSTSGVGPRPGAFTITEDDEKFTFILHPCGSGQRLVQRGKYDGPDGYGRTREAHDWSFGRAEFPLYCTHCTFMNESLPLKWYGAPLYPLDPPDDFEKDPCVWYWYKNPDDIPDRFRQRYIAAGEGSTGE